VGSKQNQEKNIPKSKVKDFWLRFRVEISKYQDLCNIDYYFKGGSKNTKPLLDFIE